MNTKAPWERRLARMLDAAGLPVKAAYKTSEVAAILAVTDTTIRRMCDRWVPDNPEQQCLECYRVGRNYRRIPYHGLVDYLERNNEWDTANAIS